MLWFVGDIIVTTAYKTGTTWTQNILATLMYQGQPIPPEAGKINSDTAVNCMNSIKIRYNSLIKIFILCIRSGDGAMDRFACPSD